MRNTGSMDLVRALRSDGRVDLPRVELVEHLLNIWQRHLPKNQLRRRCYDGENHLKDLGISIPPALRFVETVVGWPKKAITSMASRSRFDGFTVASGDADLQERVDAIVSSCNLKRKYKQAVESELIAGCDFITLSKGATGEPPSSSPPTAPKTQPQSGITGSGAWQPA